MGEARLHAVFGTGQAGSVLVEQLAVSGNRPLAGGIDRRAADAGDPEVAADTAKGASVASQSVYVPYTQRPKRFPLVQRGVLAAAERPGALLVVLENV